MNKYFYVTNITEEPIFVYAKQRPSKFTIPKSDTWVVREWEKGIGWGLPCFPEITWGRLKNFHYIGKLIDKENR